MKISVLLLICLICVKSFSFEFTTYNLGLAHTYVPYAKERTPHLIETINKSESDVLCLQEIWTAKDRDLIIEKVKASYPHSHFTKIEKYRSKKKPTCKVSNLFGKGKFVSCMNNQCKDLDGDDFTDCILTKCDNALKGLKNTNRECAAGLLAQVGKSTLGGLAAILNPFLGAELFSFGGGNGLLLLSKKELLKKDLMDFTDISTLNRRGALTAEVEGRAILCTHLTSNLSLSVPYTGIFNSWEEENQAQVDRILKKYENDKRPVYLAGDFNCGLPVPDQNLPGDFVESCQNILDKGFEDHYFENNPSCTYCINNTLYDGSNPMDGDIIDHIFTKNVEPIKSKTIYKNLVEIKINSGLKKTNMSDHFGITLETK
jgi:endonuclease/exonuclease/phosphatase family metal-dependent hydrolase